MDANRVARGLGWLSVGLGLKELSFSEQICGMLGVRGRDGLVRALGVREVLTGIGLLTQGNTSTWLWGRVAGDAIDLALLGATFRRPAVRASGWRIAATVVVAGVTLVDLLTARRMSAKRDAGVLGMELTGAPRESWRGSGLAEDVGVTPHDADANDPNRERRMRDAQEQLGLPDPATRDVPRA